MYTRVPPAFGGYVAERMAPGEGGGEEKLARFYILYEAKRSQTTRVEQPSCTPPTSRYVDCICRQNLVVQ